MVSKVTKVKTKKKVQGCFGKVVVPLSAAGALQTVGSPKKTKLLTKNKHRILLSLERGQPAFIRIVKETASILTDY